MKNKVLQKVLDEMEQDPWHIQLRRWVKLRTWVFICLTRKYWDKTYSGYIFKNKKD